MRLSSRGAGTLLSVGLFIAFGCSGGDGPKLPEGDKGQVTGRVTYKGEAVPEGSIVNFHPMDANGVIAAATVGSDGAYELQSRGTANVMAGKYKVTITAPGAEIDTTDEAAMRELYENRGGDTSEPFPKAFSSTESSGLEYEVVEGEQVIDIPLKDGGAS